MGHPFAGLLRVQTHHSWTATHLTCCQLTHLAGVSFYATIRTDSTSRRDAMPLGQPLYTTEYGAAHLGDSFALLDRLEPSSIDLVKTSPPFALQREKRYGNVDQAEY